jgi:uncharacterized membrane protein YqjE
MKSDFQQAMGKNRIKCSGGGNTLMSLMRSLSVWLVFSTWLYQLAAGLAVLVALVLLLMVGSWNIVSAKKTALRRFSEKKQ